MGRSSCIMLTSIPRNNRDRIEIMADILNMATVGRKKTHIMYKAGLSYEQLFNYLEALQRLGLLKQYIEEGKTMYITTKRGKVFIGRFSQVAEMITESPEETIVRYSHSKR
jgi:predicted transcriptional regulator